MVPPIEQLWSDATSAWPTIDVPMAAFADYIHERSASAGELRAADLLLACGCARGDRAAIAAFEEHVLGPARAALASTDHALADEVLQRVRIRLLTGAPPEIVKYRGTGALAGWVRTVCARALQDLRRAERWHVDLDDERDADARISDPDLRLVKQRYAGELSQALTAVLSDLDATERNLLKLHYLDALSTDAIAVIVRMDGSTVRRRLAKLRQHILDASRSQLADRLAIGPSECDSLIDVLGSELGTSIARILG